MPHYFQCQLDHGPVRSEDEIGTLNPQITNVSYIVAFSLIGVSHFSISLYIFIIVW